MGLLYIEGDLRLGGVIEGEVEATGDVEIDDMATVKASVAGRDVNIRGKVNGPVVARKRLIVARSGSLTGDVRVARLVIQDGASFSGKVSMGAVAEAPAKAIEPPPALIAAEPVIQAVTLPATMPVVPAPVTAARKVVAPAAAARSDGRAPKAKVVAPKGKPKRR